MTHNLVPSDRVEGAPAAADVTAIKTEAEEKKTAEEAAKAAEEAAKEPAK